VKKKKKGFAQNWGLEKEGQEKEADELVITDKGSKILMVMKGARKKNKNGCPFLKEALGLKETVALNLFRLLKKPERGARASNKSFLQGGSQGKKNRGQVSKVDGKKIKKERPLFPPRLGGSGSIGREDRGGGGARTQTRETSPNTAQIEPGGKKILPRRNVHLCNVVGTGLPEMDVTGATSRGNNGRKG